MGSLPAVTYLLDTCAFIWLDAGRRDLFGRSAQITMDAPSVRLCLSHASIWELAIKRSLGKLPTDVDLGELLRAHVSKGSFTLLPIRTEHLLEVEGLPYHHRDPFDRLLIAQARIERLPIISADQLFDAYQVDRIWS